MIRQTLDPVLSLQFESVSEEDFGKDPMARRETLELVRTYYSITQPIVRKRVSEMIKSVAGMINGEYD